MVYHVLNRGNGRMRIFRKAEDFEAFERVPAEGLHRYPFELLTYCLMPNHWHLVARPKMDDALGRWMGWVGVTHMRHIIPQPCRCCSRSRRTLRHPLARCSQPDHTLVIP